MTASGSIGTKPGHSTISRADALRAYLALGPERVSGPARALGFVWAEPEEKTPRTTVLEEDVAQEPVPIAGAVSEPRPQVQAPLAPITFWRPVAFDRSEPTLEPDHVAESQETMIDTDIRSSAPPRPAPPIVAEPRLRRRLDAELRSPRPSPAIDVDRLADRLSRGESVCELPRRAGFAQARLALIVDPSPRLTPFWVDQLRVVLSLIQRLGSNRVRQLPPPGAMPEAGFSPRITGDEIVFALSDLGFYGDENDRDRWWRWGRHLRDEGAELRALVPCPAWRWHRPTARLWGAIDWSSPEGAGHTRRPRALWGLPRADPAEVLLRLLAPAVRVEPGLLRSVRRLLGDGADLGTETDAWNHPAADGSSSRNLVIDAQRLASAENQLTASLDPSWVAAAGRAIVDWHRGRPDLVWAIEVAHLLSSGVQEEEIGVERVRRAQEVVARAAASTELSDSADRRAREGILGFWRRESVRAPVGLPEDRRFGAHVARAVRAVREADPEAPLPAGVTPAMLKGPDVDAPVQRFSVRQLGKLLRIGPVETSTVGSLLVEIQARLKIAVSDGVRAPVERTLNGDIVEVPCPEAAERLMLVTDVETVELEPWTLPAWASSAGRDGYGLWACFEVAGVEHRLRWVPPGRFLMGSPSIEEGRFDNEDPQHPVVITEGFWLAETPCTQALWLAEVESNPSEFKSDERPVEQVSWEDCQRFIDRLNFRVRDLELTLPSEAEWEYACRAGTESETWRGDLEILGYNNAPVLDEIAWYGGNSGVDFDLGAGIDSSNWSKKQRQHTHAGTREVGQKHANPWGLRDMLGNVYEWCWDPLAEYTRVLAIDPEGPGYGSLRVFRGGSWNSFARSVRSASRNAHVPGFRYSFLGFRVSRGQRARGAKGTGSSASEATRREMSRRVQSRRALAWVERLGWAVDGGVDSYGRWAAFEVESVKHRLRWIYPGRFLMGSPEDEEGRWNDEGPRQEVTLTQGFWLGEVPCVQALWEAVMGDNPSRFKSPGRPVEQVSWEECQEFLEQLNERVPGLACRLPTEAQWEFACRAGTNTATWGGDLRILGERNAPRLDELAWYGGNSGVDFDLSGGHNSSEWKEKQFLHLQAGTRDVGLKGANPWGLYDMLGNVFEWCLDQWDLGSGHPGESRVDPVGTRGAWRVSRGGSWHSRARRVRAAFRYALAPGIRFSHLGFRLSRGSQELEQAELQTGDGQDDLIESSDANRQVERLPVPHGGVAVGSQGGIKGGPNEGRNRRRGPGR